MSTRLKSWVLWCSLSFIAVAPLLIKRGLDVVTHTYHGAATQVIAQQNPYLAPIPNGDAFKYSPLFALLYSPLTFLNEKSEVLVWAALNILIFWWGLHLWWPGLRRRDSAWLIFFWILASMELDISLRYQQVNALLAGLVLWGLAEYERRRTRRAGSWLAIAANLKILPILFLGALGRRWNKKFISAALVASAVALLVPALFLGWSTNFDLHRAWFEVLFRDTQSKGLLDLQTQLGRHGFETLGQGLKIGIGVVTLVVLMVKPQYSMRWLYAFGMAALLLLSPRTESPTFVLMAPAYVLLALEFLPNKKSLGWLVALAVIGFFTTLVYTDLWPKFFFNAKGSGYLSKTLGALGLWTMCLAWRIRAAARLR